MYFYAVWLYSIQYEGLDRELLEDKQAFSACQTTSKIVRR